MKTRSKKKPSKRLRGAKKSFKMARIRMLFKVTSGILNLRSMSDYKVL